METWCGSFPSASSEYWTNNNWALPNRVKLVVYAHLKERGIAMFESPARHKQALVLTPSIVAFGVCVFNRATRCSLSGDACSRSSFLFGRIFFGEPVSTSSENALAFVWSHFLRRTGVHFVGKCSRVFASGLAFPCSLFFGLSLGSSNFLSRYPCVLFGLSRTGWRSTLVSVRCAMLRAPPCFSFCLR